MPTVRYFIRASQESEKKLVPIHVRLRSTDADINAKSGLFTNPRSFKPNKSDKKRKLVQTGIVERDKKLQELDDYLNDVVGDFGGALTKEWLEDTIDLFHNPNKKNGKQFSLFGYIENWIAQQKELVVNNSSLAVSYKQYREYERAFFYLKDFAKSRKRKLNWDDLDENFYKQFVMHLEKKGLAKNTIGKKIQTLKIFLNAAVADKQQVNMYFREPKKFVAFTESSDNIYLTMDELQKIKDLELEPGSARDRARDQFLAGCWTGLRYGDWEKIDEENIQQDEEGERYLVIIQSKTDNEVVIPVLPELERILTKNGGKIPPMISNQKFNDIIKKIAYEAGLIEPFKKKITRGGKQQEEIYEKWEMVASHTCRRSFASNMHHLGMDSLTIMSITGHSTPESFLKYIKVKPLEHAKRMRKIFLEQLPELRIVS